MCKTLIRFIRRGCFFVLYPAILTVAILAISAPEFKESIKRSCTEAGLPGEAVNGLFAWLEKQGPLMIDNRTEETPDEATGKPPGDEE